MVNLVKVLAITAVSFAAVSRPALSREIGCAPKTNAARILQSAHPNDLHLKWRGGDRIGLSWSFFSNKAAMNGPGGTYFRGYLVSPRGGIIDKNVFIFTNEWNCAPADTSRSQTLPGLTARRKAEVEKWFGSLGQTIPPAQTLAPGSPAGRSSGDQAGNACTPRTVAARILQSAHPNDLDPAWRGESTIGMSWIFMPKEAAVKGQPEGSDGTYVEGDLISPRDETQKNVFIIADEWNCAPVKRAVSRTK